MVNIAEMLKNLYLLAVNDLVIVNRQLVFQNSRRFVNVICPQGNVVSALDKQFLTAEIFNQFAVADDGEIGA